MHTYTYVYNAYYIMQESLRLSSPEEELELHSSLGKIPYYKMPTKAMKSEESTSEKEMVSITNDKYSFP